MTWSRSTKVSFDQLKSWFGNALRADPLKNPPDVALPSANVATKFLWWILGLNAIPLLFNFGGSFWIVLLALFALFYPASQLQGDDK